MLKYTLLCILFATAPLLAKPKQVIIIRHGEKPENGDSLNLKGKERAAALAPFFLGNPLVLTFGTPSAIYTTDPNAPEDVKRSYQTVYPLSQALKIPIQSSFSRTQIDELSSDVLKESSYEGKMVLISWVHQYIPQIAALLGAKDAPKTWDPNVFDRLWIITYQDDGSTVFENKPQALLFGDSVN